MLIHIINGAYGYREKKEDGQLACTVKSATRNDPPIDVDDDEAVRLVESGIAEYADPDYISALVSVSEAGTKENTSDENTDEDASENGEIENDDLTDDEDITVYTTDMKADELRAAMHERGLTVRVGMKKQDMVDALNGTDDFPDLNPQDVIEE